MFNVWAGLLPIGARCHHSARGLKTRDTTLTSSLTCQGCSTSRCIFCTPPPLMKWSMFGFHSRKAAWCCVGGRLLALWLLLRSFDKHFSASKSKALSTVKSDVANARRHGPNLNMPSGMGYSDIFWDPYLDYNSQRVKAKAPSVQLTEYFLRVALTASRRPAPTV
jgi:hypothetical protein